MRSSRDGRLVCFQFRAFRIKLCDHFFLSLLRHNTPCRLPCTTVLRHTVQQSSLRAHREASRTLSPGGGSSPFPLSACSCWHSSVKSFRGAALCFPWGAPGNTVAGSGRRRTLSLRRNCCAASKMVAPFHVPANSV